MCTYALAQQIIYNKSEINLINLKMGAHPIDYPHFRDHMMNFHSMGPQHIKILNNNNALIGYVHVKMVVD